MPLYQHICISVYLQPRVRISEDVHAMNVCSEAVTAWLLAALAGQDISLTLLSPFGPICDTHMEKFISENCQAKMQVWVSW